MNNNLGQIKHKTHRSKRLLVKIQKARPKENILTARKGLRLIIAQGILASCLHQEIS